MFCSVCGGIENVIKIHDAPIDKPRLCDVECMECGAIKYYQPYDSGSLLNLVPSKETEK